MENLNRSEQCLGKINENQISKRPFFFHLLIRTPRLNNLEEKKCHNVPSYNRELDGKLGLALKSSFGFIIGASRRISFRSLIYNHLKLTQIFTYILPNRTWNFLKLQMLLPEDIIATIRIIPILINPIPDEPIWGSNSSAIFTVKSANWLAHIFPQKIILGLLGGSRKS